MIRFLSPVPPDSHDNAIGKMPAAQHRHVGGWASPHALLIGIAFGVHSLGILTLYPHVGGGIGALSVLPVAMAGWRFGTRIGLLAGLLALPLNTLLLNIAGRSGWDVALHGGSAVGSLAVVLVGTLVGYLHDLSARLHYELTARRHIEAELRTHRDQLEQLVQARTFDLQQANTALQTALGREKALHDLKSRFVAIVSHEYRTPLTIILSSVDVLRKYEHKLSTSQRISQLDHIQHAVERMTNLLDGVLALSKAEAGQWQFKPGPVNLPVLCRALVEEIQLAVKIPQQMVFSSSDGCGDMLVDETLLRHILTNLLTNAVKYSPSNGIVTIDVTCQPDLAMIRVQDRGIGIPADSRQHLFEPFYRAQNVEHVPGTGLGLAIVKQAVDLHGGTITVESEVNVGTTFTVTLPHL